jgi:hypothetical protein
MLSVRRPGHGKLRRLSPLRPRQREFAGNVLPLHGGGIQPLRGLRQILLPPPRRDGLGQISHLQPVPGRTPPSAPCHSSFGDGCIRCCPDTSVLSKAITGLEERVVAARQPDASARSFAGPSRHWHIVCALSLCASLTTGKSRPRVLVFSLGTASPSFDAALV